MAEEAASTRGEALTRSGPPRPGAVAMPVAEGSEPTTGELLSTMATQLSELLRDEVRLAKAEIKQEATKAARGAGMLGGAGFAAYLGVVLVSFAAAWGLAVVIPTGFAFLLVGALYLVVAVVLGLRGKQQLAAVRPVPDQTVETLKEDVAWAKAQRR